MALRKVIVWTLCLGIVVLLMTTGVQAQERVEVPASTILEQIENGEENINYDNFSITGELDLSEIELETVSIKRSERQLLFELKEELKIVESKITITNSVFECDVDFSSTLVINPLDFHGTSFSGKTDFSGANFSGDTDFSYANFSGDAFFNSVSFSAGVLFDSANFSGDADFDFANFYGDASFNLASFSGDAYFGYVGFSGDAFFNSAKFDRVDFSNTKFTKISLYEADFDSMKVDWSSFEKVLVFDGPTYIKLIKNFREIEQFEDADAAYYQYRRLSHANKKWSYSKLTDVLAWVSCGYGVKPHYTIGLGVAIIMLFSLIYWRGNGIRRLKEIGGDDNRVSFWDALYFSMVTFTTVGFGDWYPVDRYRVLVMIEGFVGWLTLALFLVTLANVMIRP